MIAPFDTAPASTTVPSNTPRTAGAARTHPLGTGGNRLLPESQGGGIVPVQDSRVVDQRRIDRRIANRGDQYVHAVTRADREMLAHLLDLELGRDVHRQRSDRALRIC